MWYSLAAYFAIDKGQGWAAFGDLKTLVTKLDLAVPAAPWGPVNAVVVAPRKKGREGEEHVFNMAVRVCRLL